MLQVIIESEQEEEILLGSRGGSTEGNLHIHSVRLPGLVAHQEVIFGGIWGSFLEVFWAPRPRS